MTSKQVSNTASFAAATASTISEDEDVQAIKQLEDELKNATLNGDDDDGSEDSSSSSSASSINGATKMQANMLTASEQEVAGKKSKKEMKRCTSDTVRFCPNPHGWTRLPFLSTRALKDFDGVWGGERWEGGTTPTVRSHPI